VKDFLSDRIRKTYEVLGDCGETQSFFWSFGKIVYPTLRRKKTTGSGTGKCDRPLSRSYGGFIHDRQQRAENMIALRAMF